MRQKGYDRKVFNAYAQAVIQTMRADEHERDCLAEERVLGGDVTYYRPDERLPVDEERFVPLAMHKILVERGLCVREHTSDAGLPQLLPEPASRIRMPSAVRFSRRRVTIRE